MTFKVSKKYFFDCVSCPQQKWEAVWQCIVAQQQQSSEADFTAHWQNNEQFDLKLVSRPTLHNLITMKHVMVKEKEKANIFWGNIIVTFFWFQSNSISLLPRHCRKLQILTECGEGLVSFLASKTSPGRSGSSKNDSYQSSTHSRLSQYHSSLQ